MGISKLMGQKSCGLRMQKYIFLGQGETFLVFRILTPYGIWLFIDWYVAISVIVFAKEGFGKDEKNEYDTNNNFHKA